MNIILLSGGSGKRLWPLSNDHRSKQFLKLLKKDDGSYESMVQRVYRQIKEAGIKADIVIATNDSQVDFIKTQLGEKVNIVVEPERRDTFPAIALSSAYLALEKKADPEEPVLVLPVDPYAELEYFHVIQRMEEAVQQNAADIVLMGIKPTYPSAKYGYIIPKDAAAKDEETRSLYHVERFTEKPSEEEAGRLIAEGAFWNGGVFAYKLGYLMDLIDKYQAGTTFEGIRQNYGRLKKISFDYEVVEKAKSVAMVPYQEKWKDLGTWNTLTEEMEEAAIGPVTIGEGAVNTHVINELDIPMVVLGTTDLVVAASPDGILVSNKHKSSYLKPYVDGLNDRPMYEERRWGEYKVLDYMTHEDGIKSLTKHLAIKEGQAISYQRHLMRDEIWTVIDGTGDLVIDAMSETSGAGM